MDIDGMEKKFAKHLAAGAAQYTVDGDELSTNSMRINKIQGLIVDLSRPLFSWSTKHTGKRITRSSYAYVLI